MRLLEHSTFEAMALVSKERRVKTCVNGLPVAPTPVNMLGRFSKLMTLDHPNLCQYLELVRCQKAANAVILISEAASVSNDLYGILLNPAHSLSTNETTVIARQLSSALYYLHKMDILIGCLDLNSILVLPMDDENKNSLIQPSSDDIQIRLRSYGIGRISAYGRDVNRKIASPTALSPERIFFHQRGKGDRFSVKSDVWSMGIIMLEMMIGKPLNKIWTNKQHFKIIESCFVKSSDSVSLLPHIIDFLRNSKKVAIPEDGFESHPLYKTTSDCLFKDARSRPTSQDLATRLTDGYKAAQLNQIDIMEAHKQRVRESSDSKKWMLEELPISHAYFLWKLSGSSVEQIFLKNKWIQLAHPVIRKPRIVLTGGETCGAQDGRDLFVSHNTSYIVPMRNFIEKVNSLPPSQALFSLELHSEKRDGESTESSDEEEQSESVQACAVRENDVLFQFSQMRLCKHVLEHMPYNYSFMMKMLHHNGVPPVCRSAVWATLLLGRKQDHYTAYRDLFDEYDTLLPHPADRQLDVDIPRCHQYEAMMSSHAAHARLKRLLKVWLLDNPHLSYWQGLDSLAAVFMILNPENLPVAFACLSAFINKYLLNFFLPRNAPMLEEYFEVFLHLVAYIDPELYTSMKYMDSHDGRGLHPSYFGVSWFLTCFAHVFTLNKIFHLFDVMLLADPSFPLFVGVAMLQQLRPFIVGRTFNDVCTLFSPLPDMNMDRIIVDAKSYYDHVPPSCAFRAYGADSKKRYMEGVDGLRGLSHTMCECDLTSLSCPRMSKEEFNLRNKTGEVLILDVRAAYEINRHGGFDSSIHYPFLSFEDGQVEPPLGNIQLALDSAQNNKHPICVVSNTFDAVAKGCAAMLVHQRVSGVCILDGGYSDVRCRR